MGAECIMCFVVSLSLSSVLMSKLVLVENLSYSYKTSSFKLLLKADVSLEPATTVFYVQNTSVD